MFMGNKMLVNIRRLVHCEHLKTLHFLILKILWKHIFDQNYLIIKTEEYIITTITIIITISFSTLSLVFKRIQTLGKFHSLFLTSATVSGY